MLRTSILLLYLTLQIHASHFRNSSTVKPSQGAPATHADPESKAESVPKTKEDKEDAKAIGGLVKGLNALDGASGEAGAAMRRKYMTRSQALVTNSTKVANKAQTKTKVEDKEEKEAIAGLVNGLNKLPMRGGKVSPIGAKIANLKKSALVSNTSKTKAHTPEAPAWIKEEDKENAEAIAGLVNGLDKLPMRGGKVSPIGARIANLKKAALVWEKTLAAPTAEAAGQDGRVKRAQHALEKADAAEKSVEQEAAEGHKDAESAKEALKAKKAAAALVSSKAPVVKDGHKSTEPPTPKLQTPKAQKEDKEGKEAVAGLVDGLSKIPMRNGKVSPVGVRAATIAQRKKSALVSNAAPPAQKATEPPTPKPQTPKAQKEDKEGKEAVAGLVDGLSKIPMRNGKVSPVGVRAATIAQRKKSALVSHAAPPAQKTQTLKETTVPVDGRDAEQDKRIQHALEVADAEEKSVDEAEKEAHDEAEEARKLIKSL